MTHIQRFDFNFSDSCVGQKTSLPGGSYIFDVWGASGGGPFVAKGGFTSGLISIKKRTEFYVFIGGRGEDANIVFRKSNGGCNGGGDGGLSSSSSVYCGGGGGGATDIRFSNSMTSFEDRIIVAGGGGGCVSNIQVHGVGGYGGGLVGGPSTGNFIKSDGGSQSDGYSHGNGQNGRSGSSYGNGAEGNGGGGGGWYGGFSSQTTGASSNSGGGGGSSYISGHLGCIVQSEFIFLNTIVKSGNEDFFSPSGEMETGHFGDGFARITVFSNDYCSSHISITYTYLYTLVSLYLLFICS